MKTVFVLSDGQMGQGDPALGHKILQACLRRLVEFPDLQAVVLYNSGVRLAVQGSPVAAELTTLQEHGIDILPCGTCLDHYGLTERLIFDRASNMDEIVGTLRDAEKVITL